MKIKCKYFTLVNKLPLHVAEALRKNVPEICGEIAVELEGYLDDPVVDRFKKCMADLGLKEEVVGDNADPSVNYRLTQTPEFETSDFSGANLLEAVPVHTTHDDDNTVEMDGPLVVVTSRLESKERYDLELFRQYYEHNSPWYPGCLYLQGGIFVTKEVKQALEKQNFKGLEFHKVKICGYVKEERILEEISMLGSTVLLTQTPIRPDIPSEVRWGRTVLNKTEVANLEPFDVSFSFWGEVTGNPLVGTLTVSYRFYQWWNKNYPETMEWKPILLLD